MTKSFAVFSSLFIAGLGQIIRGGEKRSKRGLILLLTFYFAIPLFLYALLILASGKIFLLFFGPLVFAMIALWLFGVIDTLRDNESKL